MIKRTVLVVAVMASSASAQPSPEPAPDPQPAPEPPPAPDPVQPAPQPQPYPRPQPPPPPPYLQPPPAVFYPPPLPPPPHHSVCIEGRPLRCDSVFLLELGFRGGTTSVITGDLGLLINKDHDAWGLTFGFAAIERPPTARQMTFDPDRDKRLDSTGVLMGRYRRYLGDDGGAVDFSVGGNRFGVIGEVALGYRDIIAFTVGANTYENFDGKTAVGGNAGIRLGTEGVGFLLYLIGEALSHN